MVDSVGSGGETPQAQAQHAPRYLRDKVGKRAKQKTIGNLPASLRSEKDILKLIKGLDGDASGVWKNAVDMLKRVKQIDQMTTGSGLSGLATQALTRAASRSGTASAISGFEDQALKDTIAEIRARLAAIGAIEAAIAELVVLAGRLRSATETHKPRILSLIAIKIEEIARLDVSISATEMTVKLLIAFTSVLSAIDALTPAQKGGFPFDSIANPMCECCMQLDLRLTVRGKIQVPAAQQVAAMRASSMLAFSDSVSDLMLDAATELETEARSEPVFDDVETIVNEAAAWAEDRLRQLALTNGITAAALTALLAFLEELLRDKGIAKVHGSGVSYSNILSNAPALIPQVGSLVSKFMSDFLPKSINDPSKVTQAMQAFTRNVARAEAKRSATAEVLQPNQDADAPDPSTNLPTATADIGVGSPRA